MAITTTPEQLIINDMLPEELRDYNRVLDKKGLNGLLTRIAKEYTDKYPDIAFKLMQFGQHMAYISGGESFGLSDLRPAPIVKRFREELDRDIQEILKRNYKKGKESDDPDVRKEVQAAIDSWSELVRSGAKEYAKETENPLYDQAFGTGSLKKNIFESILGTDIQYQDADNNPVDIPILESYSEGLSPVSYFAGATGTRKGIVDLQKATQDAGYLAKQLVQIAHRNVIVDRDGEDEYDESRPLGYPVPTDDPDNEGSFLAHPVAGYPRNTLLTPKILNDIRRQGVDNILVRSAIVGGPTNGGLYAYDAGIRERGDLPATGDFVGISAAQSISEPLTQASISSKHSGGSVGADAARGISGFQYINQLLQVPKHFPGGAAHSEVDGIVDDIIEAPQGGKYVMVGGKQHYVGMSHGHQIGVKVNKGDVIEAGDVLSDGIPNPAQIVKHKGLGEGRRYYVDTFRQAIKDAGSNIHRRNIEVLSKGVLGYVRLKDEIGDYAPNDVMPYSMIANSWQPREGYLTGKPSAMVGRYLERPVLHYTIGTRIQPSMAKKMEEFGVSAVDAHDEPPPFEPEMIRGMAHVANDPDWATRFLGSYNKNSLLESARRGGTSNLQGTSYVPRLAFGDAFGDAEQDNIRQTRAGKLF